MSFFSKFLSVVEINVSHKIKCCTATNKAIPGTPNSAITLAVIRLIGINNPVTVVNELNKNKTSAAMMNLTPKRPRNRKGFAEAPTNNRRITKAPNKSKTQSPNTFPSQQTARLTSLYVIRKEIEHKKEPLY